MSKKIKYLIDELAKHGINVEYTMCQIYTRTGAKTTYFFEHKGHPEDDFEEETEKAVINRLVYALAKLRAKK